jgi:catechol 2,3-dioxygenase-like lactoylglutathione lyase family enzyme
MLDHVAITVSDISAAERFYDAIINACPETLRTSC